MGLETGTYIDSLNSANPLGSDAKSAGDDHIRLIKSTIKATFPNITGAVTPTHVELNYVDGVTSAIQAQLDGKQAAGSYQPLDDQLTTLAGITAQQATDLAALSTFMGTVLNDADAATARATLELATVSQAEAEAGTATTTRAWTAERVKQAIAALSAGLGGASQAWTDVKTTPGRALGTTYTNSTGKPISVHVVINVNASQNATLTVSGIQVYYFGNATASTAGFTATAIVPNGATYVAASSGGTLSTWFELR